MSFKEKCQKFPYFGGLEGGYCFWLGFFCFVALLLGIIVTVVTIVPTLNVLGTISGIGQILCAIAGLIGARTKGALMTFICMVGFLIFFTLGVLSLVFFDKSILHWIFVIISLVVHLIIVFLAFAARGYSVRLVPRESAQ